MSRHDGIGSRTNLPHLGHSLIGIDNAKGRVPRRRTPNPHVQAEKEQEKKARKTLKRGWYPICILSVPVVLLCGLCALSGHAGGLLHVDHAELAGEVIAIARPNILLSRVLITVSHNRITYAFEQVYHNNNEFRLNARYFLPIGRTDPHVQAEVRINGTKKAFRTANPEQFFDQLKAMASSSGDPSILGLSGHHALNVDSFTVDKNQLITVNVTYSTRLKRTTDLLEILFPLTGESYSLAPVGLLKIRVRFALGKPIRTVFSPSHQISVLRESPERCMVRTQYRKRRIRNDFRLISTFSTGAFNFRIFPFRRPGNVGSFVGFVEPPLLSTEKQATAKDLVVVLDCSDSMDENLLRAAKKAAILSIHRLESQDRFNIITVSTRPEKFSDDLLHATTVNVKRASAFVDSVKRAGGTDLYNAFVEGLLQFTKRSRPSYLVFAGDGRATVGKTNAPEIIADLKNRNRNGVRFCLLALGDAANLAFLDTLAQSTRGWMVHSKGRKDFSAVLNTLLSAIFLPRVSNASVDFGTRNVREVFPKPLPSSMRDEPILVVGRYAGQGNLKTTIRLRAGFRGRSATAQRTYVFPQRALQYDFVPYLWAMRKLGRLSETRLLKGPNQALTQRIGRLAHDFALRNPLEAPRETAGTLMESERKRQSRLLWTLKTSTVPAEMVAPRCRIVRGVIFRRNSGAWVEAEYQPDMKPLRLRFLSEAYFSFLKANPSLAPYYALGPRVVFVHKNQAYRIE